MKSWNGYLTSKRKNVNYFSMDGIFVRDRLVSSANSDILDQLPILPQQHSIIMGDCVRTPVQTRINDIYPRPKSKNPEFVKTWLDDKKDQIDYEVICNRWQSGEK